jgi:hypothetical protein
MANAKTMLGLILLSSVDEDAAGGSGGDGGGINHEELLLTLALSVSITKRNPLSLSLSGYLEEGLLDLFGLGRWWMRMAMQQGRRESRQEQKEMRRVPAAVSGLEGREALCEKSSMD